MPNDFWMGLPPKIVPPTLARHRFKVQCAECDVFEFSETRMRPCWNCGEEVGPIPKPVPVHPNA